MASTSRARVIIDTDPGIDDILALLLALSAKADEIEVLLISLVYGNTNVHGCLHNLLTMLETIDRERDWRQKNGLPRGFETLEKYPPRVAIGAEKPLEYEFVQMDRHHGKDGLGGTSSQPTQYQSDWEDSFYPHSAAQADADNSETACSGSKPFIPSKVPAHEEILNILSSNEPDTISIVSLGPMTNIALAASKQPDIFLRAKQIICMGGTFSVKGRISPYADFNTYMDPHATAKVISMTSSNLFSSSLGIPTDQISASSTSMDKSPESFFKLFPLDLTIQHTLSEQAWSACCASQPDSPLVNWVNTFLTSAFTKSAATRHQEGPRGHRSSSKPDKQGKSIALNDPVCIWYFLTTSTASSTPESQDSIPAWSSNLLRGVNVETGNIQTRGQWTFQTHTTSLPNSSSSVVTRMVDSPPSPAFSHVLLEKVFGYSAE